MKQNSVTVVAGMAFAAAIAMGGAGAAEAAVYDISADFSNDFVAPASPVNPNGVWTYGYSSTLGGSLTLYDVSTLGGNGIQGWHSSVLYAAGTPSVWNNPTGSAVSGWPISMPGNTAAFHPGPDGEYSVYQFTSPVTGSFALSANFFALDSGAPRVYILANGATLYSATDLTSTAVSYSATLALAAGGTVDFAVGVGSNGWYGFDSTDISATLSPVGATPLPSTWLMLISGFVGLGFFAHRGTKKRTAALAAA